MKTGILPRLKGYGMTLGFVLGAVGGMAGMYFFDPQRGHRRRNIVYDQFAGMLRHRYHAAQRTVTYARGFINGSFERVIHGDPRKHLPADDRTLTDKLESMLARDPQFPKHRVFIDTAKGIVELRGELDTPEQIQAVEEQVRAFAGVYDVHNYLHTPQTPAPNKLAALEAE